MTAAVPTPPTDEDQIRREDVATKTRRRPSLPTTSDLVGLMCRIVRGSENLHGAACVGRARLFDPDVPAAVVGHRDEVARWEEIQRTCQTCPVRGQCWAWASHLPSGRVTGPTAASVVNPLQMKRRSGGAGSPAA